MYTRDPSGGLVGIQQGGTAVYAWTDRHTDVVAQFTASGTTLAGSTAYDPLGRVITATGPIGNLGFQQEFTDPDSGRVNMHARWYNPETGQFDTRDTATLSPFGDSANANRYGYGNGNPLANIDPSGHSIMKSCNGVFSCLLKGFVDSFDVWDMARTAINAFSNLRGSINSFLGGLAGDANRWKSSIGNTIHDKIDCGSFWVLKGLCNNGVNAVATIGGWACALTGICDIAYDCLSANGNRNNCAMAAGGLLADAVKSLITGGAAGLASRMASRISSLMKRFGLPAKNKGKPGGTKKPKPKPKAKPKPKPKPDKKKPKPKKKPAPAKSKPSKTKPAPKKTSPKKSTPAKTKPKTKPAKPRTAPPAKPNLNLPTATTRDGSGPGYDNRVDYGTALDCEGHSFDPATRVLMADGSTKAIKDVRVGDKVTATDPATDKTAAAPVTVLHKNVDTELTDVTVSSAPPAKRVEQGEGKGGRSTRGPTETVLHTTQNHPFWDEASRSWVDAGKLRPGVSVLRAPDGTRSYVTAVHNFTGTKEMRDLTVADTHTYHVLAGTEGVLVHNCGGGLDANGNACECSSRQPRADLGRVYLGGRHGDLKVDTPKGPRNPAGIEINHMPAHSSTDMPFSQGWAIQMDRADHRQLASTGGGPGSAQADYRARQKALWDSGDTAGAVMMDIEDIRLKFGTKYDSAILQMLEGIAR